MEAPAVWRTIISSIKFPQINESGAQSGALGIITVALVHVALGLHRSGFLIKTSLNVAAVMPSSPYSDVAITVGHVDRSSVLTVPSSPKISTAGAIMVQLECVSLVSISLETRYVVDYT